MAQTVASMAGLHGSAQAVLDRSCQISGSGLLIGSASAVKPATRPNGIRAQHSTDAEATASTRRAMLGLVAAGIGAGSFAQTVLAEATRIKIGPPPPLSGGLPGTLNSDEPRDVELPLKNRFFIQPLPADLAAKRAKESAQEIVGVKSFISKKQWPYVRMDLRNKASYLRYDIDTVIAAKPKEDKKPLKELTKDLFAKIDQLDHAAKIKSLPEAEKYYAETVSALDTVISKLG